ncbi:MAG TPA: hypothetical protein GXX40_09355 [Firmicutes bacterium]|nr:hypothetical protein [Bacillota bacterium]
MQLHRNNALAHIARLALYSAVFFVLFQILLVVCLPLSTVYYYRMDYDVVKDNIADVGATLDMVKREIRQKHLEDYVILLGDSIMYSGPGGPTQSIGYFLNRGCEWVFNLAIPAAQMGDFYTLLLMLDERGISTDHVVLNLTYAGFVKRDPDPPIVYWLGRELARLDLETYRSIAPDLARSREKQWSSDPFDSYLEYEVYPRIPVLKYKDFIRAAVERKLGLRPIQEGDPRPWREKAYLKELLKQPVYRKTFDPSPLQLDDANPNVAFLKRIAEHQKGKDLLLFMSPINPELMQDEINEPGFVRNEVRLNSFLEDMACHYGFQYIDLSGVISPDQFADHVHLTGEGYKSLARIIRKEILSAWGVAPWVSTHHSS